METRLYEIQGSEFYMSMSYHIPQLVPRGKAVFLLKHFILLEKGKNCHSIVVTVLQIHIKIESLKAGLRCVRQPNPAEAKVDHLLLTIIFYDCFHKRSTSGG